MAVSVLMKFMLGLRKITTQINNGTEDRYIFCVYAYTYAYTHFVIHFSY